MKTIKEQKAKLRAKISKLREQERKEINARRERKYKEAQKAKKKKFKNLKKRDPSNIKISGVHGSHSLKRELTRENIDILKDYEELSRNFSRSMRILEDYYNSNDHRKLMKQVLKVAKNSDWVQEQLISGNKFKTKKKK